MQKEPSQQELDQNHLRNWQELEITFNTPGWKTVIQPILDKMITDVVGKKNEDGTWDSGSFGDKRIGEIKADRLLWYRQFGIDFTNRLFALKNVANRAKERLEKAQQDKDEKQNIPMFDSSYALKEGDKNE